MKMKYGLGFIDDDTLINHVRKTVESYRFSINLQEFNQNVLDPIKLTFDSLVYGQGFEQTIENEVLRQLDKSNTNVIGYFHQNIFQYINSNWIVPDRGYDIVCPTQNIFVEMKNKHNTMNSSSASKTYMRFQNTLIENPLAVCYLVEVISKRSQDVPWKISLDGSRQITNNRLRKISIDKFYELVTGDKLAFMKLCQTLPRVIADVVENKISSEKKNTVVSELKAISSDTLKSLYILAFSNYEGFNHFNHNRS